MNDAAHTEHLEKHQKSKIREILFDFREKTIAYESFRFLDKKFRKIFLQ